jgi:hypothetical protein
MWNERFILEVRDSAIPVHPHGPLCTVETIFHPKIFIQSTTGIYKSFECIII